jgi:hypothetical protein
MATATSSQQSESSCSCTTTPLLEIDVESSTTTAVSSCSIPGMLLDDRLQLEQQARQRRRCVKGAGSSSSASRNSSGMISTWQTARSSTRPSRPDRQHRQQQRQRQQQHHPNKPPSATQRAGLFMLFAVLLTLWHYMRTVWWTHGRLAARHARFLQQEQRHDGMHLHHHDYPAAGRMIRRAAPGNIHLDESFQNHQVEEAQNHPQRPAHPLREQNATNSNEKRHGANDEQRQRGRIQQHQQQQDDDDEDEKSTSRNESRTQQQQHQQPKKMNLSKLSTHALQALFVKEQQQHQQQIGIVDHTTAAALASPDDSIVPDILMTWLDQVNRDIVNNVHGGIRWVLPILLPPLSPDPAVTSLIDEERGDKDKRKLKKSKKQPRIFLDVLREQKKTHFAWQEEWSKMKARAQTRPKVVDSASADVARYLAAHQPVVDYTSAQKYRYPPLLEEPRQEAGVYPQLTTLTSIMEHWDQDEDYDGIITETLMHFNYSNPSEMEMARQYRIAELPFKLTNVPELIAANQKWTDEYLSQQFDNDDDNVQMRDKSNAQESPNHYFAYYNPSKWQVETMGLAPVRTNDWTFATWSEHAKYADAVQLSPDQPHFYWQAGIGPEERFLNPAVQNQSFITRDLPSWSSTTPNFITFEPESQKGIQCRFGERGVVAATHYDAGRNMVGMITGAKRYILSPPNSCHNLGIVTSRTSPIFRHSLLNFGHLKYIRGDKNNKNNNGDKMTKEDNQMSQEEHAWLERASQAQAVETVLKAGEVLYIVSALLSYFVDICSPCLVYFFVRSHMSLLLTCT